MNTKLITLLLASGLGISSIPVWAVTDISFCDEINQPGSYRVTQDLVSKAGTHCLLIDANDVTIDLQGHTITGAGTGAGITVPANSSLSNIELRNGTVRAFRYGIALSGVSGAQVERLRVIGNARGGIEIGSSGVTTNAVIIDNIASENGFGISARAGSLVRGNVTNSNGAGISVVCPSLVSDNTAIDNSSDKANLRLFGPGCISSNNVAPKPE